jgi:hypothetical protein
MNEMVAQGATRTVYDSPRIWTVTCGRWSDFSESGQSFGGIGSDCTGSPPRSMVNVFDEVARSGGLAGRLGGWPAPLRGRCACLPFRWAMFAPGAGLLAPGQSVATWRRR